MPGVMHIPKDSKNQWILMVSGKYLESEASVEVQSMWVTCWCATVRLTFRNYMYSLYIQYQFNITKIQIGIIKPTILSFLNNNYNSDHENLVF